MIKTCSRCKIEKLVSEFYNDGRNKDGRCSHCKECHNEQSSAANRKVGSKSWAAGKLSNGRRAAKRFGHHHPVGSSQDVVNLWNQCGGCCVICGSADRLCLDHCHDTGKLRGFLCFTHNIMVGYFERDDVELVNSYLERK